MKNCRRIFSARRVLLINFGKKIIIITSLQFKQIHRIKPIYSVRIGIGWRAVGVKDGDEIVWYWIGSHEEYNNLIARL